MKLMRKLFAILFLCCFVGTMHSQESSQQYRVNYLSSDGTSLSVRSVGYDKKKDKAVEAAEQAAVMSLLFRGIPGSQQSLPLIGTDEAAIIKAHQAYFDVFLKEKRYKGFITSSIPVSKFGKDASGRKFISMDITINLKALRADLEQQDIIRKFGI